MQEIPSDYTKMSMQESVRQLPPPTDDTSQEFEAYKNRMGYDAAKRVSVIRFLSGRRYFLSRSGRSASRHQILSVLHRYSRRYAVGPDLGCGTDPGDRCHDRRRDAAV